MNEKKKALELHRLKNWVDVATSSMADIKALQAQAHEIGARMIQLQGQVSMSVLEIEEQRLRLAELGVTDAEMDRVAKTPEIPINPMAILDVASPQKR